MNALQQDYDFESIHSVVCPPVETLTLGQRFNREWPSAQDMVTFLGLLNEGEFIESKTTTTPVCPAYWQAMNNILIGPPQKKWANGSAYVSHRLTAKGRAYLCWLKVVTYKSKALAVRACTALVVVGHWQRLTIVDMINQATDAEYTMLIRERASTYSMVGGLT